MHTTNTPLPGVGALHVLAAQDGHRVGVVRHADDRRGLVVYDRPTRTPASPASCSPRPRRASSPTSSASTAR